MPQSRVAASRPPVRPAGPAEPAPRVRRDPEQTRALILDAADHLFAVRGPDAVGLKDVARDAGVSHALVSHYFGTYAGLVDSVLERRARNMRERVVAMLAEAPDIHPSTLLGSLWDVLTDRSAARVTAWAILSGKAEGAEFFPRRVQGLKLVVDAMMERSRRARGGSSARISSSWPRSRWRRPSGTRSPGPSCASRSGGSRAPPRAPTSAPGWPRCSRRTSRRAGRPRPGQGSR